MDLGKLEKLTSGRCGVKKGLFHPDLGEALKMGGKFWPKVGGLNVTTDSDHPYGYDTIMQTTMIIVRAILAFSFMLGVSLTLWPVGGIVSTGIVIAVCSIFLFIANEA